jgi:hypothetical protein
MAVCMSNDPLVVSAPIEKSDEFGPCSMYLGYSRNRLLTSIPLSLDADDLVALGG